MGRLAELLVRPRDHRGVAVEVAELPATGLVRSMPPAALAAPLDAVAPPGARADAVRLAQCLVGSLERGRVAVERELDAVREVRAAPTRGWGALGGLSRAERDGQRLAVLEDRLRDDT